MKTNRYTFLAVGNSSGMMLDPDGAWVTYQDYKWMSDYADRLVEFGNLPCLPKDLENLREANLQLAMENQALKDAIADLKNELTLLTL